MSQEKLLLALDGGTGSFRAIIFNTLGQQIAVAQREWQHLPDVKYPGSIDFNCHKNWELIKDCIREILSKDGISPSQIAAISTTSMREGFVIYDDQQSELLAFSNVDARSNKEAIQLKEEFPDLESEFYEETGQSFALSAVPRLLWLKKHEPEKFNKMYKFNMLNDWIAFKLTGKLVTEPSNASTTGLFSLKTRNWNIDFAQRIGININVLPEVIESGLLIGGVSEKGESETGLKLGTPVVAGGGDAQLGCIGIGATKTNDIALFGGSFWQLEYNTNKPDVDQSKKTRVNCHAIPNMWQYESIAWSPGLAMTWFRDGFCQYEKDEAKRTGKNVYSLLDPHIKDIPAGSYGMFALFADEMNFLDLKHAAPTFTNFKLEPDKFNKYTFYKAIMESAGIITYGHLSRVTKIMNYKPEKITFAGGASNNPIWCQIIADILGVSIQTPVEKEATALGAALLAGVSVGLYQDLAEAEKLIKWDQTYYPNMENHKIYQKKYQDWKKIYKSQLQLSDEGITTHLWIAPGVK